MILGSLLLTVAALALLLVGLVNGSDPALVGSIAASLLAAIAIVVGSRRAGADRVPPERASATGEVIGDEEPALVAAGDLATGDGVDERVAAGDGEPVATVRDEPEPVIPAARAAIDEAAVRDEAREHAVTEPVIPVQGGAPRRDRADLPDGGLEALDDSGDEEPPDEPVAQQVPAGDAARVARMSNEVLVIDGRPRYHLTDCPHLLGRASEALPVHEAVELGFTPCGLCEPDTALLAEAGRV